MPIPGKVSQLHWIRRSQLSTISHLLLIQVWLKYSNSCTWLTLQYFLHIIQAFDCGGL